MSDTALAILILPVLIGLTLILECTRVGCSKLSNRLRTRQHPEADPASAQMQSE